MTDIYLQPVAISASRISATTVSLDKVEQGKSSGYRIVSPSATGDLATGGFEPRLIKRSFSSVPVVSMAELAAEYGELGQALGEMATLGEDDEWWVESPVADVARCVAGELMNGGYPAPQLFTHGPKSLVFNWSRGSDNLYLTVSSDSISVLISTPQKIKRRINYPVQALANPERLFPAIESAYLERPVVTLKSASSDVHDRSL
jgi:hypothetical protein